MDLLGILFSMLGLHTEDFRVSFDFGDQPDVFDWRDRGVVTDPKNQGSCDAGWAFALVGAIESQYAIKYGELLDFSAQELIDCTYDCNGCRSYCNADTALDNLEDLGDLEEESSYPFVSKAGQCKRKQALSRVNITGHKKLTVNDEDQLKELLAEEGPLYIDVDGDSLNHYKQGIMEECPGKHINHAVLLVGYGDENGKNYWIVKNSKGQAWGESGFARIRRDVNACGLLKTGTIYKINIDKS